MYPGETIIAAQSVGCTRFGPHFTALRRPLQGVKRSLGQFSGRFFTSECHFRPSVAVQVQSARPLRVNSSRVSSPVRVMRRNLVNPNECLPRRRDEVTFLGFRMHF